MTSQSFYNSVFGYDYSTGTNRELFDGKIPDGYDIINDETLIIIENKKKTTKLREAKKQILDRYITQAVKRFKNIYCIIGTNSGEQFGYMIYSYNDEQLVKIDIDLDDLYNIIHPSREELVVDPHSINQYLYDNSINIPKTQKTLFLSFMLIVLKIDPLFIEHYNSLPIDILIDKMFSIIDEKYNDRVFTNQFDFIRRSLHNKHIPKIISMLSLYMTHNKNQNCDMLNKFYNEFCIYDKNGEGKLGIVLTPDDVVELMVKELDIKPADYVLDTCTGTGSFLVKSSQYTDHLVGCENNEERYALAKCNFILHDMDYKHLYHESCFNVEFPVCDKLIINPPFGCDCSDEKSSRNDTSWKSFKREQKFVLHAIQFIREGGMGVVIIPGSNFNESNVLFKTEILKHITPVKIYNCSKDLFKPNATVKCSIMVFIKYPNNQSEITLIEHENDGYKLVKGIRIKENDCRDITHRIQIDATTDWNKQCYNESIAITTDMIIEYNILYYFHEKHIDMSISNIYKHAGMITNYIPIDMMNSISVEQVLFSDIFEPVKTSKHNISKTTNGPYPLISSSMKNNGCCKYISEYDLDGEYFTISYAREPNTGYTSYHDYKFSVTSCVGVFKCKIPGYKKECKHLLCLFVTGRLNNYFDRSTTINNSSIMNVSLHIPV